MKIEVKRLYLKDEYTIGKMYLNGKYFCDTVEDKVRKLNSAADKVYGETAIPAGTYDVQITWSNRFKRNLPLIMNVPYFEGIRIHALNYASQSEGCIGVGENKVKGGVINSEIWEGRLMDILNALPKNEKITIIIA